MSFADIGKLYLPAMVNCCSAWRRKSNAEYPIPEIADALASSSSGKKCEIAKRFPAMMRRSSRRRRSGWSMLGKPTNVVSVLTAPSLKQACRQERQKIVCYLLLKYARLGKVIMNLGDKKDRFGKQTRVKTMHSTFRGHRAFSFALYCLILLLLLNASSSNATPITRHTSLAPGIQSPVRRGFSPVGTATTTLSMPPTQTTCPPAGAARAMITAPLVSGAHQNIIYTLNLGTYDAPSSGNLMRYDAQTGQKAVLMSAVNAHIYEAQVSADGQWILFVTTTGSTDRQTKLQALRMDGQGLQTLYCAPGFGIRQVHWSTDQHFLVFYNVIDEQGTVYLLDMRSGKLQIELIAPPDFGIILRTWLDATHIYLTEAPSDTLFFHVYLLDIHRGAHQHLSDLLSVVFRQYGDFDSSYDGSHLLISYGGCPQGGCSGPSSIATQAITGGRQQTIYHSQVYDVIAVRAIDQGSLLFIIGNTFTSTGQNIDKSHNGLWAINTDGYGLTRLVPISAQQYYFLNYDAQEPWSNVSRDGSMYVLQVNGFRNAPQGLVETDTLFVGSLHSGQPRIFAATNDGSQLVMAGWTVV